MKRKRYTEAQIAFALRQAESGTSVAEITRKLGITGLKKLCGLLEGFGMNCEIGLAGNTLLNAANLHVIMSITNCDYYEYWMPVAAHQCQQHPAGGRRRRSHLTLPCATGSRSDHPRRRSAGSPCAAVTITS